MVFMVTMDTYLNMPYCYAMQQICGGLRQSSLAIVLAHIWACSYMSFPRRWRSKDNCTTNQNSKSFSIYGSIRQFRKLWLPIHYQQRIVIDGWMSSVQLQAAQRRVLLLAATELPLPFIAYPVPCNTKSDARQQ